MKILDGLLKRRVGKSSTAPTGVSQLPTSRPFAEGLVSIKDVIAPGAIEVDWDFLHIDSRYYRTMFVSGFPRFVGMNWLSGLINFDASLSISMYIYPTDGKEILDDLRRKIAEMEAELTTDMQRGKIVNPATQAKLEDALNLQADLVKGEERFFQFGLYITLSAKSKEDLNKITKNLESTLGALLITTKKATLQMEQGFTTTLPICTDSLQITRNMDTTSLATTFPFVSSDLSDDKGIMYGLNEHNGSLVIFDRFTMPNYNSVVFASAGAGKSYMIKLEVMRSLMLGTEIIVIDPENEYRDLCEAVGGQYIAFGYGEASKINPFDLSLVVDEGENALNDKILGLHKLFKVMIGEMDPLDESILDRAIMDAYKMKGITPDPETQNKEPPLLEDLYKSLVGMEDPKAQMLTARFEKYIKGSFAGMFNQKSTVDLKSPFVVFGIRNLEESLRPVAMHIILDYIWTSIKKTLKKRILVVDEAWYMMQFADSAAFLRGIVKRGRKYYLGVTTITQDVDDFLQAPFGKEIVTNSSIQILLKQHSAAIDLIGETFYLSEGEKQLLLSADKGQGIFFAGQNHVALRVIASPEEHALITSNPEEVLKAKAMAAKFKAEKLVVPETKNESPKVEMKPAEKLRPEVVELSLNSKPGTILETKTDLTPAPPLSTKAEMPSDFRKQFKEELVEAGNKHNDLANKISELEAKAKVEIKQHEETLLLEEKNKHELSNNLPPSLPKYQDLFKAQPTKNNSQAKEDLLPPLPPLPPLAPSVPPSVEPTMTEPKNLTLGKPSTGNMVAVDQNKPNEKVLMNKKSGYDDLFANGII